MNYGFRLIPFQSTSIVNNRLQSLTIDYNRLLLLIDWNWISYRFAVWSMSSDEINVNQFWIEKWKYDEQLQINSHHQSLTVDYNRQLLLIDFKVGSNKTPKIAVNSNRMKPIKQNNNKKEYGRKRGGKLFEIDFSLKGKWRWIATAEDIWKGTFSLFLSLLDSMDSRGEYSTHYSTTTSRTESSK